MHVEEGVAQLGPARLVLAGRLETAGPLFEGTAQSGSVRPRPARALGGPDRARRPPRSGRVLRPRAGRRAVLRREARCPAARLCRQRRQPARHRQRHAFRPGLDRPGTRARGKPVGPRQGFRDRRRGAGSISKASKRRASARPCASPLRLTSPWTPMAASASPGSAVALGRGGRLQAAGRWGPERAELTATVASLPLVARRPLRARPPPRGRGVGRAACHRSRRSAGDTWHRAGHRPEGRGRVGQGPPGCVGAGRRTACRTKRPTARGGRRRRRRAAHGLRAAAARLRADLAAGGEP